MFSPKSNPRSTNSKSFNFSIEVTGTNTIQFYFNGNVYNGSPSKPQNLKVVPNSSYKPYLTWDANTETDLSGYQVWRKINTHGSWMLIGSPTTNSYTDNEILTSLPWSDVFYKIKAKDTQILYSVYSNEVSIKGTLRKTNDEFEEESEIENLPTEYRLVQNYPNPFNPSTTIKYDIPKNNQVTLKVYNSIGKEVSEIVNGFKQAGSYSVTFDASKLPSGVYFYKLQAGEYSQVNKMILIK